LVVVFEEYGGPAVAGRADEILRSGNGALELGEDPIPWCGLKFVRALSDIDNVLLRSGDVTTLGK
jgi:hypothetical protein